MKRFLVLALALCLMCSILPMAAMAAPNKTCKVCGTVMLKDDQNNWYCPNFSGHPHEHTWGKGEVTTEPTCTSEGVMTYKCSCGETKTESIPLKKHKFTQNVDGREPSCDDVGFNKHKKCEICGEEEPYDTIPVLGHDWDEGEVITPATCSKTGVKTYTCQRNSEHTKTEEIPISEDAHDWDEGKVTTPATCSKTGVKTYTCQLNSKHTKTEEIPKDSTNHNLVDQNDNNDHWQVCECGYETPHEPHYDEDGWSYVDGSGHYYECTKCGKRYKTEEHKMTQGKPVSEATCEKAADYTFTCDDCGYSETRSVGEALGHKMETIPEVPATCTKNGISGYKKCTRAGCPYMEGSPDVIPATGHTKSEKWSTNKHCHFHVCEDCGIRLEQSKHEFGKWHREKDPTYWKKGLDERHCKECGYTETREVDRLQHNSQHTPDRSNPKTSDDSNIYMWTAVLGVSAIALIGAGVYLAKKKRK